MEKENGIKDSGLLRIGYYLTTISAVVLLFGAVLASRPSGAGLVTVWLFLDTAFFAFFGFQFLAFCLTLLALVQIIRGKKRGINLLIITFVSIALYSSLALIFYRRVFGTT